MILTWLYHSFEISSIRSLTSASDIPVAMAIISTDALEANNLLIVAFFSRVSPSTRPSLPYQWSSWCRGRPLGCPRIHEFLWSECCYLSLLSFFYSIHTTIFIFAAKNTTFILNQQINPWKFCRLRCICCFIQIPLFGLSSYAFTYPLWPTETASQPLDHYGVGNENAFFSDFNKLLLY